MQQRLNTLLIIFACLFLFIAGKLGYIQLVNGLEYAQQAELMHRRFIPQEPIPRGSVLDRQFRDLTDTRPGLALVVLPSLVEDTQTLSEGVQSVFGTVYNLDVISTSDNWQKPIVLDTFTSWDQANALNKKNLPGVFVVPLTTRYGPRSMARHLVGHLTAGDGTTLPVLGTENKPQVDYMGSTGIEQQYNAELAYGDSPALWSLFFDARGNIVPGLSFEQIKTPNSSRYSVVTTVDKDIQLEVENIMNQRVKKGAVVVLDAQSGEVLAAASRPNYLQDRVENYLSQADAPLLNRIINNYYPGSIFKIIVAAAALEEGVVSLEETFNCTGNYRFDSGLEIPCWKSDGHGELTFAQALAQSCNPTFIEVALRLGRGKLLEYAQAFGLDQEVLLGYSLKEHNSLTVGYSDGDLGNAAVGQKGIRISPLKVATMTGVIASGGDWTPPALVKNIIDGQGRVVETIPSGVSRAVISTTTAEKVRQMMELTTTEGTGTKAWLPEGAAGKTSSAETGQINSNGSQVVNAWFTGFVPAEHPRYVVTVLVEGGNYGGQVAAPIFKEIGSLLLKDKK